MQRMAGSANLGLLNVIGLSGAKSAGRASHDRCLIGLDLVGTIFGTQPLSVWRVDHEATDETFGRTELVLADLMAERTGDAIGSEAACGIVGIERKVRKDLAVTAVLLRVIAGH